MRPIAISFFILATMIIPTNVLVAQEASVSPNGTIDDRLSGAINDQHLQLDESKQNDIKLKCQATQHIFSDMQQKTDGLIRKRVDLYNELQKDLIAIQLRMVRQGADASEIDLLTGKIQQGLDRFTLVADQYGTSLNDVMLVNCTQKPEQFQAGLIMMRMQRSLLLKSATDLKNSMLQAPQDTYIPLKNRLRV